MTGRIILDLQQSLWSTSDARWSEDGAELTLVLRRYPGDAPALTLVLQPDTRRCTLIIPTETVVLPCQRVQHWLEAWYARHRTESTT